VRSGHYGRAWQHSGPARRRHGRYLSFTGLCT